MTKEEFNKKQRERRLLTNNRDTHKYEKTKKGFLMRCYRNMKSRVFGIQKKKVHLYLGKELLDKDKFYNWSINNKEFNVLFDNWERNNYNRKICPSINRMNSSIGYIINNIEWITHSENSRDGALKRWKNNKLI